MIFWLLILAVVIAAAAWFVRSVTGRGERPSHSARRPSALDVLEERYARGEINRDEYLRKRSDVLG